MSIVVQLLTLFGPLLVEALQKWLEEKLEAVAREGMSGADALDAVRNTLPWYSLRPRTWRRRAMLARFRDELVANPGALHKPLQGAFSFQTRMELRDLAKAAE